MFFSRVLSSFSRSIVGAWEGLSKQVCFCTGFCTFCTFLFLQMHTPLLALSYLNPRLMATIGEKVDGTNPWVDRRPRGPYLNDVCKMSGFFDPLPLITVTITQPPFLSSAFWVPPPHQSTSADVISIASSTSWFILKEKSVVRAIFVHPLTSIQFI